MVAEFPSLPWTDLEEDTGHGSLQVPVQSMKASESKTAWFLGQQIVFQGIL